MNRKSKTKVDTQLSLMFVAEHSGMEGDCSESADESHDVQHACFTVCTVFRGQRGGRERRQQVLLSEVVLGREMEMRTSSVPRLTTTTTSSGQMIKCSNWRLKWPHNGRGRNVARLRIRSPNVFYQFLWGSKYTMRWEIHLNGWRLGDAATVAA